MAQRAMALGAAVSCEQLGANSPIIGVRDSLTGYVVPERIGDRAWMAWENSSAAAAAAVAAVAVVAAVAHPIPFGRNVD